MRGNVKELVIRFVHTSSGKALLLLVTLAGAAAVVLGTPRLGVVATIISKGVVPDRIHQEVEVNKNPDGKVDPWEAELHAHGDSDVYTQHVVLTPGGYSGWHTHPGIVIATVVNGSIDAYDSNCNKRTIKTGEVFFERDTTHAIINNGSVNADFYGTLIVKHGVASLLDAAAPSCAGTTPIP